MIRKNLHLMRLALVGIALLIGVSWQIQRQIRIDAQRETEQALTTVLETTRQAFKSWTQKHRAMAGIQAESPTVRRAATGLLSLSRDREELLASPAQIRLRQWFEPIEGWTGYMGYFIIDPDHISLASSRDANVGTENLLVQQRAFLEKIWAGETACSLPQKSDVPLGNREAEEMPPTMFVGAPIEDESGKIVAIFTFRINPAEDFTAILQQGRIGRSGETYAFNIRDVIWNLQSGDDAAVLTQVVYRVLRDMDVHFYRCGVQNPVQLSANHRRIGRIPARHHQRPAGYSEDRSRQDGCRTDRIWAVGDPRRGDEADGVEGA